MKIEFLDAAKVELLESYSFYENQKNGLGDEFNKSIESGLKHISENPEGYPIEYKNIRKYTVNVFPFLILYIYYDKKKEIKIIGVFHSSRNPKLWKKR